jgi:hypothetical protein
MFPVYLLVWDVTCAHSCFVGVGILICGSRYMCIRTKNTILWYDINDFKRVLHAPPSLKWKLRGPNTFIVHCIFFIAHVRIRQRWMTATPLSTGAEELLWILSVGFTFSRTSLTYT